MGWVLDRETGFEHLRARYYDPTTAQFLGRDPLVGKPVLDTLQKAVSAVVAVLPST